MCYGGPEILKVREAGNRPADIVLVSLLGPLRIPNPCVWLGKKHLVKLETGDTGLWWGYLAELDVEIVTDTSVPFASLLNLIRELSATVHGLFVWWRDIDYRLTVQWTQSNPVIFFGELPKTASVSVREFTSKLRSAMVKELRCAIPQEKS